jgi:hypothetical protein
MSESMSRRLRRAEDALAARGSPAEHRAAAAYWRVVDGTAVWRDHEILGGAHAAGRRARTGWHNHTRRVRQPRLAVHATTGPSSTNHNLKFDRRASALGHKVPGRGVTGAQGQVTEPE